MKLDLGEWAREGRGISLFLVVAAVALYLGLKEYQHRRNVAFVNSHPYSTATIKEVLIVHTARGGSYKLGRVAFNATILGVETRCEATVRIGNVSTYYEPGDRIKVVPRLDTCNNPLVPNIVLNNGTGF